jgi:hypothetical protein
MIRTRDRKIDDGKEINEMFTRQQHFALMIIGQVEGFGFK